MWKDLDPTEYLDLDPQTLSSLIENADIFNIMRARARKEIMRGRKLRSC